MFQTKNLSVLGSNLLFKGVDESVINSIFNSKNFRAEKEGELIFQSGEDSNFLYLILQGEVKLKYSGTKGSSGSFRRMKNEFFGEKEILEKTARVTSAVADTDCIFYLLSKEELFTIINQHRIVLQNLDFTEGEGNFEINFTGDTSAEDPANENIIEDASEEKTFEEIIMDEDLADYSFDSPETEELNDFSNENYLTYPGNGEPENVDFGNNGFHPEENNFEEKTEEIVNDFLNEDPGSDSTETGLPEKLNEEINPDEERYTPLNDFENLPEEPQKFAFDQNENFIGHDDYSPENKQTETETVTLIKCTANFVYANIQFSFNEITKLSGLLTKTSALPEAKQVNELIEKHISSVKSIISTSLEFLTQGKNYTFRKKKVKDILNNILNLLSEYVETRNVKLYKKIDADAELEADEEKLYNAFFQLAKNACDSMPDGGNIFVTAVNENNNVKIEFIDEGPGIPSSLTFEIFEPLVTHGKQDGAGLGLSIAKKIIENHNGNISVEGELGEGARFIITLPFSGIAV